MQVGTVLLEPEAGSSSTLAFWFCFFMQRWCLGSFDPQNQDNDDQAIWMSIWNAKTMRETVVTIPIQQSSRLMTTFQAR